MVGRKVRFGVDKPEAVTDTKYRGFLQNMTEYVVAINRNFEIVMANDLFKEGSGSE